MLEDSALDHHILALIVIQMLRATGQMVASSLSIADYLQASSQLPPFLQSFYSFLALFALDFSFLQPGCLFDNSSFELLFYGTIIAMGVLCLITLPFIPLVGLIRHAQLIRFDPKKAVEIRSWYFNRAIRSVTVVISFLYFNIANISIQG